MACSALGRDRIDLPRAESSFCHRCHSPLFCAGLQPTRPSIIGIFNYGTTMPQLKVMLVIRIFSGSILQRCTAASPSQTPLRLLGPSSLIGQIGDHSLQWLEHNLASIQPFLALSLLWRSKPIDQIGHPKLNNRHSRVNSVGHSGQPNQRCFCSSPIFLLHCQVHIKHT